MKEVVRGYIERTLTTARLLPHTFGVNLFTDIRHRLPRQHFKTIFDVGANDGETSADLRLRFPLAKIHCFEPNPDMAARIRRMDHSLDVHAIALGSSARLSGFDRSGSSADLFRLTDAASDCTVSVETLDAFCAAREINAIDYLKIDTEGHDLEVIRGATELLGRGSIGILQAEVSMNCDNNLHARLSDVQKHMEGLGYRLFGLYEQMFEWPNHAPNLRRANAVFLSPKVIADNRMA